MNIYEKIKVGEALTLKLIDDTLINIGVIRMEDNLITFYTGKGLNEIFKPNMTLQEKEISEQLKLLTESEMKNQGFVNEIKLTEIIEVI